MVILELGLYFTFDVLWFNSLFICSSLDLAQFLSDLCNIITNWVEYFTYSHFPCEQTVKFLFIEIHVEINISDYTHHHMFKDLTILTGDYYTINSLGLIVQLNLPRIIESD